MVVVCDANAVIEYDRRRSGLPSAPLNMEYDNNRTIVISLNINIGYTIISILIITFTRHVRTGILTLLHLSIYNYESYHLRYMRKLKLGQGYQGYYFHCHHWKCRWKCRCWRPEVLNWDRNWRTLAAAWVDTGEGAPKCFFYDCENGSRACQYEDRHIPSSRRLLVPLSSYLRI